MSIFQSIRWVTIFEKQLAAFPNYSSSELFKARNIKDAHIDRVNQEVYNRIDGKILSFTKAEKKEYWPKFLAFLVCLSWEKDAFLFMELFEIEMTPEEKENNKRRDMVLKGIENDIQNDKNADKLESGLKYFKRIALLVLLIIAIYFWETALAIIFFLFIFAMFIGLLSLIMPRAGTIFRIFLIWRYW